MRGQLQRHHRLLMGRQLARVKHHLFGQRREGFLVQIDARAPENLLEIVPDRQRVGVMGGDAPDAGTDREGHLDLLVDRRLVTAGA
jgi:hypothetical protein